MTQRELAIVTAWAAVGAAAKILGQVQLPEDLPPQVLERYADVAAAADELGAALGQLAEKRRLSLPR